jgi:hypothetical protein
MVYGLLPNLLVRVLGVTAVSVGLIEGAGEGSMALARVLSGLASDRLCRRKPLVLLGYAISAANKIIFPLAAGMPVILAARAIDRIYAILALACAALTLKSSANSSFVKFILINASALGSAAWANSELPANDSSA